MLWNGQTTPLPHNSTAIPTATTTENGTIRLNMNPMNRLDNENLNDGQENFYHTLTPFNSQYEEHSCVHNQPSMILRIKLNCMENLFFIALFGYTSDRSTCPIHHRIINYPSDTFPLKTCLNNKDNLITKKLNGNSFHHHGTCQRHLKPKRITASIVTESMNLISISYRRNSF
jgi:hypothetical protein